MDSCLLCLGVINDMLDVISVNSTKWQKLDIRYILEKHFWTLNTIQSRSWICLSCWEKVEDFHNFYLCIEEAHNNYNEMKDIKIKDECELKQPMEPNMTNKYNKLVVTFDDDDEEDEEEMMEEDEEQEKKEEIKEMDIKLSNLQDHNSNDNIIEDTNMYENDDDDDDDEDNDNQIFEEFFENISNFAEEDLENTQYYNTVEIDKEENLSEQSKNTKIQNFQTKNLAEIETVLVIQEDTDNISINSEIEHSYDNINSNNNDNENIEHIKDIKDNASKTQQKCIYFTEYMKTKRSKSNEENDNFIAEHFKPLECDLCFKTLENFQALQKHFQTEHQQKGYIFCCNRKHYSRTNLIEHIHRHLNPNFFKCPRCDLVLADRFNLKYHIMRVHEPDKSYFKHRCDKCGKSFQSAKRLQAHNITHEPIKEKNFHCIHCGKSYATNESLKNHIDIIHLKKQAKICAVCGKSCNTPSDYRTHMRIHEVNPETAVNCDECGVRVKSEHHLKLHKKAQHPVEGKQDAPCPVCGKMYRKGRSLRSHILYIHKKGYDYKCSFCEKSFKRPDALKEHTATHTGTPLYSCPWCPRTFNSHSNMRVHRRKVHPIEHEEAELKKLNGIETDEFDSFKIEIDINE